MIKILIMKKDKNKPLDLFTFDAPRCTDALRIFEGNFDLIFIFPWGIVSKQL